METELKLLVADKDLERLRLALRQYAGSVRPTRSRLLSHYFDTPSLQFRDNQAALRVRRIGRQWLQTLKGGGGIESGLHRRGEWETAVDKRRPDLNRLLAGFPDDPALRRLLKKCSAADTLEALFSTDFHRETLLLTATDGSQLEAAIDEGWVRAGDRQQLILEVELELKQGNLVAIFEIARRLNRVAPVTLGISSKAERGYALAGSAKPAEPQRAAAVRLTATMPVDEAFARIFNECLTHLSGNLEGVIAARDPEYLHQMRVALRRLRAALVLFGDAVPKAQYAHLAERFGAAGRLFGEARNWDVLRHDTVPAYSKARDQALTPALMEKLRERARRATAKASRLSHSRAFTDSLLVAGAWTLGRAWRDAATETTVTALAEPVGAFARRAVAKRHRQLMKRYAAIVATEPDTLHAVRIAAKKLRYAVEFFATLFPKKKLRPYLAALAEMQDGLGAVNDAATAASLLTMATAESAALSEEAALLNVWLTQRSDEQRTRFAQRWRGFAALNAVPE